MASLQERTVEARIEVKGLQAEVRRLRGLSGILHEELRQAQHSAATRTYFNVVAALNRHSSDDREPFQHPDGGPAARGRVSVGLGPRGLFDPHVDVKTEPFGTGAIFRGNVATSEFGVRLVTRRIAAYITGGTGIYASKHRGGPYAPYIVSARGAGTTFLDAINHQQQGHDRLRFFWRAVGHWVSPESVTIPGTHPSKVVALAIKESQRESKQFYEDAVKRFARRANANVGSVKIRG